MLLLILSGGRKPPDEGKGEKKMATTYQYSDGNSSCGHKHRTKNAARNCPDHLRLIRDWWKSDADHNAYENFAEYEAESIAKAEIIESQGNQS